MRDRAARPADTDALAEDTSWAPPVLSSIAAKEEGITGIIESLDLHFNYLERTGTLRERRRERLVERVIEVAERRMRQRLWDVPAARTWLDGRVSELEAGSATPYAVADDLLSAYGHLVTGTNT
nr:methylmalonyl Co-A mutase-associated GTPase MeaB [Gemmatimonadota bacterium]